MNTDHLTALNVRLSHERARLQSAKTEQQRTVFAVRVAQCEREVAGELKFLGMSQNVMLEISDDDLLNELIG